MPCFPLAAFDGVLSLQHHRSRASGITNKKLMSKIYSYAEYLPIAKVGDVVRAVEGKKNHCMEMEKGVKTQVCKIENGEVYFGNDCAGHGAYEDCFLEIVSSPVRIPTWEDLQVGDEIMTDSDKAKILVVLGEVFLRSAKGDYDTAHIWMTKKEAQKYGWTLVTPPTEPEVEEMTLEDVNKLLGKKIKIIE